jgi:hypothetical protein
MSRIRTQQGQASVELIALLPLIVVLAAVLWQAVLAGQAAWLAGSAARAAARAQAVGGDPVAAARRVLPARLTHGLGVRAGSDGSVTVSVPVPLAMGSGRLATIVQRAQLAPQSP